MALYTNSTLDVIRSRKDASKEFNSFFTNASIEDWDSSLFLRLSLNKEVANTIDLEQAKLVHQSLKTTLDSFT